MTSLMLLQSCSNTLIGKKLENSFDTNENLIKLENISKAEEPKKTKQIKKVKLSRIDENKENEKTQENIVKENLISSKDRFNQKITKSAKKVIFNPQPYRIILRLSGANPSAPAETVTKALRKAGVQFEVEKIERFEAESLLKDSSFTRKEF